MNGSQAKNDVAVEIPDAFDGLFTPSRYKVYYGGRGSGKSWSMARAAIVDAISGNHLWLCAREFQNSIKDSVYQTLLDQIAGFKLQPFFKATNTEINCLATGSRFIFKGLHHNIHEIKSLEGVDRCWVEEAQNMSAMSLAVLIPTIRRENSEIWFSFNPYDPTDAVFQYFVDNGEDDFAPPPDSIIRKVNWDENPYFPQALEAERLLMLERNPEGYGWVWEGECRSTDETTVFKNVAIDGFESPPIDTPREKVRWRFGADWGFAKDPSTLVRSFIKDGICFVDEEAYGFHVELDALPDLWRQIPGSSTHRVYADSARPETISHLRSKGFDARPCTKYAGSVEEGITYLQNFKKIVVHPRCKNLIRELRLYRWKVTKTTEEITKVPEDKNNHLIDALRYAYDEEINHKSRGLNISTNTVQKFIMGMRRG